LLQEAYGRWPAVATDASPLEHLRWKRDGPLPATIVLGETAQGIVAMTLRAFRAARLGGQDVVVQLGQDSCVSPGLRRSGVMSAVRAGLGDVLDTRGDLLIYTSAHPAFDRIRTQEGAVRLGAAIQVLTRNGTGENVSAPGDAITVRERTSFDARVDELGAKAAREFDFIYARTREFLNWRYCDARAGTFTVLTAEADGALLGYTVLKTTDGLGQVADLLVLPARDDVLRELVASALQRFDAQGLSAVQCWCPARHPYRSALTNAGFTEKTGIHLDWLGFTDAADAALLKSRVLRAHVMVGDTDLV
jgi:hypothetical protein